MSPDTPTTVVKAFVCDEVKIEDADARTIRFTITTDAPDRHKDTVAADGWDLSDYKKNPVVLWAHAYDQPPIARTIAIERTSHGLSAVAQFPTADVSPFADSIYRLIKGGYLNASSVGFRPDEAEVNGKRGGIDFLKQSLLEWSVVPVPANAQALVEARAAGYDVTLVKQWAEGVISALAEPEVKADPTPDPLVALAAEVAALKAQLDAQTKAGARHSKGDMHLIQTAHDTICALGASCGDEEMKQIARAVQQHVATETLEDRLILELDDPLTLDLADPDPLTFEFDASQLSASLSTLIAQELKAVVSAELARAAGRLD